MKRFFPLFAIVLLLSACTCKTADKPRDDVRTYSLSVQEIWSNENYCSFTSLVKYHDRYYCTFREAGAHHYERNRETEGKIRIIVSDNGYDWQSLALYAIESMDLRDPKLNITPDGRLMLLCGGVLYENTEYKGSFTKAAFSEDGATFSELQDCHIDPAISQDREWLWRLTWFGDTGYAVAYGPTFCLMKTTDGLNYEHVSTMDVTGFPNETTVRFTSDSTMYIMVRREKEGNQGYWGVARPPYTEWQWTEMDIPLGGPDFCILGDTLCIVATRSLYASEKTMLLKGGLDGHFEEVCILPSGGDDNSYTGMLIEGDELWVTYYSRHEQPMSEIFMARVPMQWFTSPATNRYFYPSQITGQYRAE